VKGGLHPLAVGERHIIACWLPADIWITRSADGRLAHVYHAEITSAPVYRLDIDAGKRQLVATLVVNDAAGLTAIPAILMTPGGKLYADSYRRELSGLFVVEEVR
jgi:hypothetical protein